MEIAEELRHLLFAAHLVENAPVISEPVRIGDEGIFRTRDHDELPPARLKGGEVGIGRIKLPLIGPEHGLVLFIGNIDRILAVSPPLEETQKLDKSILQIGNKERRGLTPERRRKEERAAPLRVDGRAMQVFEHLFLRLVEPEPFTERLHVRGREFYFPGVGEEIIPLRAARQDGVLFDDAPLERRDLLLCKDRRRVGTGDGDDPRKGLLQVIAVAGRTDGDDAVVVLGILLRLLQCLIAARTPTEKVRPPDLFAVKGLGELFPDRRHKVRRAVGKVQPALGAAVHLSAVQRAAHIGIRCRKPVRDARVEAPLHDDARLSAVARAEEPLVPPLKGQNENAGNVRLLRGIQLIRHPAARG